MPFIFLIVKESSEDTISLKQIFGVCFHWKSFLPILTITTIYVLCAMFLDHGRWWINPSIIVSQVLCKFLIVGFVEELVYRGFGYNALSNYMNERKANIVSNLFFVALHLPAYFIHWYCDGVFSLAAMLAQSINAFVYGSIFGVVFRKSKSIWASAIVHFWYDFAFSVFVG